MIPDCDEEKLQKEFDEDLDAFLHKWRMREDCNEGIIALTLIREAKIASCIQWDCYYHMLGILTDYMQLDLREMFNEIRKE